MDTAMKTNQQSVPIRPHKKRTDRLLSHAIVYGYIVVIIVPILFLAMSSFKTNIEINRVLSWPSGVYLDNYIKVFQNPYALMGFVNSAYITVVSISIAVFICALGGYALGRRKEKLFLVFYLFFLSAMMIPVATNLVSLYVIFKNLHLIDTRTALILKYIAGAIPMGVLMYTGFVKTIPRELDEAATIDGCGYLVRFRKVILPLLKPVMISHAVISSIGVWNDFIMPLLLITSNGKKPLTLAVYSFSSEHANDWGPIFALLTLSIIPPILFFLFMQKHFYKGFTVGAVKG